MMQENSYFYFCSPILGMPEPHVDERSPVEPEPVHLVDYHELEPVHALLLQEGGQVRHKGQQLVEAISERHHHAQLVPAGRGLAAPRGDQLPGQTRAVVQQRRAGAAVIAAGAAVRLLLLPPEQDLRGEVRGRAQEE